MELNHRHPRYKRGALTSELQAHCILLIITNSATSANAAEMPGAGTVCVAEPACVRQLALQYLLKYA